jgi:hypothetical protein
VLQDLISIAVAAGGVGLVALAVKQARSKGWAGSLQLAAGGFLLIGASAIGIVGFLAGIVLSPLAWLGVVALGLAGVLFIAGQRLEGRTPKADRGQAVERRQQKAVEARPAAADDDMAEIEEILRRHGIQ